MLIRGRVPVAGPVQVQVFVLEPESLQSFLCDESTSGFAPSDPGTSNFTLSVRAECVEGRSNNLRICWGQDLCSALVFEPGEVDVGLLRADTGATPAPPDGGGPVSPTGVRLDIATETVTWSDNSSDETGFHLELTVNGTTATYEVDADVTSFRLPAGHPDAECGLFRVSVSAVSASGASEPDSTNLVLECQLAAPASAPTPGSITLPSTGTGLGQPLAAQRATLVALVLALSGGLAFVGSAALSVPAVLVGVWVRGNDERRS